MSDELAIIILMALVAATFCFFFIISKKIASWFFKHLSPTVKQRLSNYYKANFFSTLINGAFAGLCVGPFYSIPLGIYIVISDWIKNDFEIIYLLGFFVLTVFVPILSLIFALFGIVFWLLSNLILSVGVIISKSNPNLYIKGEINTTNQLPLLFVLIFFGAMIISLSFPEINLLACLVLSGCLELGKTIWQWIVCYFACKCTKVFQNKFQTYGSIIIFLISLFCIFFSCIHGKSIDFVKFGDTVLHYGPLLLFFSFYDELLKSSYIRKLRNVGLLIALSSMGLSVDDVNFSHIKSLTAPIYIFSSALSFVLTFVLTRNIWFSIVAVVLSMISLKKPEYKWMYVTFGIVVSFTLLPQNSSFYNNNLLILAVSFLFAMSSLIIEYLKTIVWEDIDLKDQEELIKNLKEFNDS